MPVRRSSAEMKKIQSKSRTTNKNKQQNQTETEAQQNQNEEREKDEREENKIAPGVFSASSLLRLLFGFIIIACSKSLNPYEANGEADGSKLLATRVPFIFRLNNHRADTARSKKKKPFN